MAAFAKSWRRQWARCSPGEPAGASIRPPGCGGVGAEVGASLCDPATASPMLSGSDHGKRLGQDNPILCGI
jgi:hypothetical protein